MTEYLQLINDGVTAVVAIGGFVGVLVKTGHLSIGTAKEVVSDIAHVAEDVIKTPAGKVIEAQLHHRLNGLTDDLQQSELGRLALGAVLGLEKSVAEMSSNEKVAVIALIKSKLPDGAQINDADILKALDAAQEVAHEFSADPAVKKAQEYDAILESINKPQQEVIQDVQTQQTPA